MITLCEKCAADLRGGKIVTCPPTVLLSLERFLESFEAVFGDADWLVTLANLQSDGIKHLIHPDGTFLQPGVADESNNWWNRGALLTAYRDLKAELETAKFCILCREGLQ